MREEEEELSVIINVNSERIFFESNTHKRKRRTSNIIYNMKII
jgi:hypothetical protein